MRNRATKVNTQKSWRKTLGAVAAVGVFLGAGVAYADDPVTMAPPVPVENVPGDTPADASQDSVFNWREVPENQHVTITRAVFDRGGYQLYDDVGETIVVPFTDQNLYVMKFGHSDDGAMHFVNDGAEPILYVPRNGYLENATVPGAKWYPFPHDEDRAPADPVFLGIAPSWSDYVDMGWYPDMDYYGGYYCREPFVEGTLLVPTFGLFISIGDRPYYGWTDYHHYYEYHPAPYHVRIDDANIYHWGNHPNWGGRHFEGGGGFAQRNFSGDHAFGGGRFGSNAYSARSFAGSGQFSGGRHFSGGDGNGGGNQAWAHRSFGGGERIFRGGQDAQAAPAFGGSGRTFSSGSGFGSPRAFSSSPRTFGGGRDSGGGGRDSGGGGRDSGGGGRDSGGGGTGGGTDNARSSDGGNGGGFGGGGHRR